MDFNSSDSKCPASQSQKSHSFPQMDDAFEWRTEAPDGDHACFKPLFRDACIHDVLLSPGSLGTSAADANQDYEEQVRREGFNKGFDAGQHDACSLAQQEITPEIASFAAALNRLRECLVRTEESSWRQIRKMALAITENILGVGASTNPDRLAELEAEMKHHTADFYRFSVMLNPEDMDMLTRFMACENPQWQECEYIQIDGDNQIQRGSLLVQPGAQSISIDRALIQAMDNVSAEVSTK